MKEQLSPTLAAAVLLLARDLCPEWPITVKEILTLTTAGKSQAYELKKRLLDLLPELMGRPGRPAATTPEPSSQIEILQAIQNYLMEHPGAVAAQGDRRSYSDGFRRLLVDLAAPGQPADGLPLADLATLVQLPLGTLKDWFHGRSSPVESDTPSENASPEAPVSEVIRNTHLQTIAMLWQSWEGTFQDFCRTAREEHRLPYGPTFIGDFLLAAGLRQRRSKPHGEAPWCRNSFRSLFPGAQWLGDGTSVALFMQGHPFVFNITALLDVASNATVGFAVTHSESVEALKQAYADALETTGEGPLSLTLDNKPCNLSPDVTEAVKDVTLLYGTPGRGQSKAALEGSFGLFKQALPDLEVSGDTPQEMARSVLQLVLRAWFRGRNRRPRRRFEGRCPAEVYQNSAPTPEELKLYRQWVRELQRRQERARRTREARLDPVRIQLLEDGLSQLELEDSTLAKSLARYSRESILRGLMIFEAKKKLDKVPHEAQQQKNYLGGIIRNVDARLELEYYADFVLNQRLRARDFCLAPLTEAASRVEASTPPEDRPRSFIDRALNSKFAIDFRFWTKAAASALQALPATLRGALYKPLTRRVAVSSKTSKARRFALIDHLATAAAI